MTTEAPLPRDANPKRNFAPTTLADWARSDEYHNSFLIRPDEALQAALEHSEKSGLPSIAVSTAQGKFLKLLVQSLGAKKVLEVGTLGGYSTIWMAQGLPADGQIITLEISQHHAEVARQNFERAGFASKIEVIVGPGGDSMKKLEADPPFDFIFVDADKPSNPIYFAEAKRLVKKGGVIIIDNVVRNGRVANTDYVDDNVEGVRKLLQVLKEDDEVEATTMGLAGEKGYDGYMYILKK
ncbi:O-methyltransferase family 3 protein [Clavulina sp. PMI_390]|nr:O-methyltransferase family 3 protein [Clavulina sp. PMI_390]